MAPEPTKDAVTMKTWAYLKESMEKISQEVQQVMFVQNDIGSIEQDLTVQENLWHQAEIELGQENSGLQAKVESLRVQVRGGLQVEGEVMALRHQIEEAKRATLAKRQEFVNEEKQWVLERQFLEDRSRKLNEQLKIANQSIDREVDQAHWQQLQLQTDAAALKLKQQQLQDLALRALPAEMEAQRQKADFKTADLQRQLTEMHQGLALIKSQQIPAPQLSKELTALEMRLKHEIASLVELKQKEVENVAECDHRREDRQAALAAEVGKAQLRHQETLRLCEPIRGQQSVLQGLLNECQLQLAGGPAPQQNVVGDGVPSPTLSGTRPPSPFLPPAQFAQTNWR